MRKIARKSFFLLAGVVFLAISFPAMAKNLGSNLEYSGYLQTEAWLKVYNDESHFSLSSFKNTVDLETQYKFSDNWAFFFHPRYFYDAAYSLRNDYDSNFDRNQEYMGHTQRTEWLRDCYLDYTSDKLDVRIGKQQVVWGQADGLPFLDRVMPFDLTKYWLPDFADIRIPLWMVKVEYSPQINSTLQFLVIPDFEASRSAPPHDTFAFKSANDFDTFKKVNLRYGGTNDVQIYRPSTKLKNSRLGLRWRSMFAGIDYTLNYLYGYSTSAYTYTDSFIPTANPADPSSIGDYKWSRRHKIMQIMGFSFNRTITNPGPFEGLTIRGEFAYLHNEPTYYGTQGHRSYTEKSDKYTYVLGFDKSYFTKWDFSLQFAQFIHNSPTFKGKHVLNTYTYGLMDKVENYLTLKVSTDFLHERIKPEVLVIYGDDNDGRISFKTKFQATDNWWFTLGYYHFWGPAYGSNGEYRNNDQLVFTVKRTF